MFLIFLKENQWVKIEQLIRDLEALKSALANDPPKRTSFQLEWEDMEEVPDTRPRDPTVH